MAYNLKSIIDGLLSDKIKERQDALALVDETIEENSIATRFSGQGSIKTWSALLDALFQAVTREKLNCVKKGIPKVTVVSLNRLEKAGSVVRNATEKNFVHFTYKLVRPLLEHLMSAMIDRGKDMLLRPLSLNYIKAMVVICSYNPHLDHMDVDVWTSLVSLAFAVILGDSLLGSRGFGETDVDRNAHQEDLTEDFSTIMDVDDEDEAEEEELVSQTIGAKRSRAKSPALRRRVRSPSRYATPSDTHRTISQEQIELMGLLVILLRARQAPYLRRNIASKILNRFERFFTIFPSWTIAHANAVASINTVMSEVELNETQAAIQFAFNMWSPLLSYWNGKEKKDKAIKEELVIAMTRFFSLVTYPNAVDSLKSGPLDRIEDLFNCLQSDIDKSAFETLSLDCLRLHLHNLNDELGVFEAHTFRSGFKFDSLPALSWAILELQADCVRELHLSSERYDGHTQLKRRRRDTPVVEILATIRKDTIPSKKRTDNLQLLLFIIDRHWGVLHTDLQSDICGSLLALLSHDDLTLQSWTFMCFAAIVTSNGIHKDTMVDWDAIWSQAVHRVNVLGVGRAASHAAHALLSTQKLHTHRVLTEIETFAANIVIQGPSFPFDSVCAFVCDCLRIASQDMRLYRIQLPSKVLAWLSQNWNLIGPDLRYSLPSYAVTDFLTLLEVVCSMSKPHEVSQRYLLPENALTDFVVDRHRTAAQRDYLFHSRLRPFRIADRPKHHRSVASEAQSQDSPLITANALENKVSALFIKSLELLFGEWEVVDGVPVDATPEKIRRTIDAVVIALYFEASLARHGTQSNRRVIQAACKLMRRITPCIGLAKWKPNERATILIGLEPLVSDGELQHEDDPWDLILGPVKESGVRRSTLTRLTANAENGISSSRRELRSVLWKSADVQDAFEHVIAALRTTLEVVTTSTQPTAHGQREDDDDFERIQVANTTPLTSRARPRAKEIVIELSTTFLAVAPMLQSTSYAATHDKQLIALLENCDDTAFLSLAPEFLHNVRHKHLRITAKIAETFLDRLQEVLRDSYSTKRSVGGALLAIQFLHSTSHLWMQPTASSETLAHSVRKLHQWLGTAMLQKKLPSWRVRDRLVCYLDYYLTIDASERFWYPSSHNEDEEQDMDNHDSLLPSHILPSVADDEDVRVRFRLAIANGRLLQAAEMMNFKPTDVYDETRQSLGRTLDQREHILTRFIYLGNAMIVSSAVRRGPYWHLIETCLYSNSEHQYTGPIHAILSAVAVRLGFIDLRTLFEVYASQMVESFNISERSFFTLPPILLGYENRRSCNQLSFAFFAPMLLIGTVGLSVNEEQTRLQRFADHCQKAHKSVANGVLECFPDAVGAAILDVFAQRTDVSEDPSDQILCQIGTMYGHMNREEAVVGLIQRQLDRVVYAIVRTVRDIDYSRSGSISQALRDQTIFERAAPTFSALNAYRKSTEFAMHEGNLPLCAAGTIIESLVWLNAYCGDVFNSPTIYHVIHYLVAAIDESPLVNEQLRLVHALMIWVSINTASFKDVTLLRTLLHGAVILLSQFDLARSAQGIITWTLAHYRRQKLMEPTIPDIMSRIARIGHDYSQRYDDPIVAVLGNDMIDWIEKEVRALSVEEITKPQALNALILWPRQPGQSLAAIADDVNQFQTSHMLSEILQGQQDPLGKFRLVRRLGDLSDMAAYSAEQFCGHDFWHLKSCIPQQDDIQDEDVNAFAYLLFKHSAQIRSLGADVITSNSASTLQIQEVRAGQVPSLAAMRSIVLSLLHILSTEDSVQIHRAYTTLRLIFGLDIEQLQVTNSWPGEYQEEIVYLSACTLPPKAAPTRSFEDLETREMMQITNFQQWICHTARFFNEILAIKKPFYAQLSASVNSDPVFAEQILPVIIHAVLCSFGSKARTAISKYFSSILSEGASPDCCRSIIAIVQHLRNFDVNSPSNKHDPLAYDKWLNVNFYLLTRAAMSCGAYTTAFLFLELAVEYSNISADDPSNEGILYDIYSHIEEPDGFYAIRTSDVHTFLTKRFHHEGQWDMAFKFHGAEFAAGHHGRQGAEGICQSLHSSGFDKLAMSVFQSSHSFMLESAQAVSKLGYELAWRTQMWDLPEPHDHNETGSALYTALRAIHRNRDQDTVDALLRNACHNEMRCLSLTRNEDMVAIRTHVRTIVSLAEIRKWRDHIVQGQLGYKTLTPQLTEDFVNISSDFDFSTLENIVATRMSLLLSAKQREQRDQIGDLQSPFVTELKQLERNCLLRLSEAARLSENNQTALNAIIHAQRLENIPSFEVGEEFSQVLWLLKEHKSAVEYLRRLVADIAATVTDTQGATKCALALSRLGAWSAEACLQKPEDIHEEYFVRATNLLLETKEGGQSLHPTLAIVFQQYALFAEEQYHAILRSPEVSRLKVYTDRKKLEIEQLERTMATGGAHQDQYLSEHVRKARMLQAEDEAQYAVHTQAQATFLGQATKMYARCLQVSDEFDDSAIIRFCSLWFSNFNDSTIQPKFGYALKIIPSRKFISLARQLSARLSKPDGPVEVPPAQKLLEQLIVRMCNEHPFHIAYQVWALRQIDNSLPKEPNRRHSWRHSVDESVPSCRSKAAQEVFSKCLHYGPSAERLNQIDFACTAYLEWAIYPIKKKGKAGPSRGTIPDIRLKKVVDFSIPVTTAHTPVDFTMKYEDLVTIKNYASTFKTAGGQALPKITDCIGSDGKCYVQLFKGEGNDDLRQDAVMEQVFELVNVILKRDRHTKKRELNIRCYKVIPLSPQAGLLEFVQHTMPLLSWLAPAHPKYRPTDISAHEFRTKMDRWRGISDSGPMCVRSEEIVAEYVKMKATFRPVFRHFFTEKNKLPMAWFSARLKYARSVATTSIVGHILGLGDRHVSNILIDDTSGELVHIDLGIAFDQGKLLPIPELVPFRLTEDIVDGFGIAGTDGVFRRCAEETLRVLRTESGVIMSVLEVFRHDPLHSWAANARRIQRIQAPRSSEGSTHTHSAPPVTMSNFSIGIDMESDNAEESADRALTSVRRKLDQSLSVQYTVNELITAATDVKNLSHIFKGWSPFY